MFFPESNESLIPLRIPRLLGSMATYRRSFREKNGDALKWFSTGPCHPFGAGSNTFLWLAAGRSGDTEEDKDCAIKPHHILVAEAADTHAEFRLWDTRNLVHHQSAGGAQAIALARRDGQSKQRSVGRVGGKRAHRHRTGHIETVVLENHGGTWLFRVVFTTCKCPNLSALQLVPQSETASMNS